MLTSPLPLCIHDALQSEDPVDDPAFDTVKHINTLFPNEQVNVPSLLYESCVMDGCGCECVGVGVRE